MRISFDPAKRIRTLKERGLDFADAGAIFMSRRTFTMEDDRFDYPEIRYITVGFLADRMVVMAWTVDSWLNRRIISMRYCHAKERKHFEEAMGGP